VIRTSVVRVEQYGVRRGEDMFWRKRKEEGAITVQCIRCGHEEKWKPELMRNWPKMQCEICNSPLAVPLKEGLNPGINIIPPKPPVTKKGGSNMPKDKDPLQIKINVDTSELDAAIEKAKKLNSLMQQAEFKMLDKGEIVIPLCDGKVVSELAHKHKDDAMDPIANAMAAFKHIQSEYGQDKKDKLLVIELDDIDAVPKVTYKGQSMNPLQELELYWETATDLVSNNPAQLRIKSADKNCNSRTIGHNI